MRSSFEMRPDPMAELREDVRRFFDRASSFADPFARDGRPFFLRDERTIVARAPGRLDVMGGIADYSGSLVLQWPIAEATCCAVQRTEDSRVRVCSLAANDGGAPRRYEISTEELARLAEEGYEGARALWGSSPETAWVAYVLGTLLVLHRERGLSLEQGYRILVSSEVPEGKGVSSSAAIEVATMRALADHAELRLDGVELALLCQRAENHVAGAPCGIMDPMTSSLGKEGRLLALLCQPAEVQGHVEVPESLAFFGIDSGVRHAVSGSDYGAVRVGAFLGYRLLAELAGLPIEPGIRKGHVRVGDTLWNGYLANVTPEVFEREYARDLPEVVEGRTFLERHQGITDLVTRVDPERTYAVLQPTRHPIHEHARVRRFAQLLEHGDEDAAREMGESMFASHESYSACGLGCAATDRIVEIVRAAGPDSGLYGAKITGGGSGGTVAILARRDAYDKVATIARTVQSPLPPFTGSSPGARSFTAPL